ncbi:MAG TPA: hypothetical protein VH088_10615 [Terriglobales bacterium]|jgi:hypothetical protein|nr:hypothetical protein [Terriglobales bacterium]
MRFLWIVIFVALTSSAFSQEPPLSQDQIRTLIRQSAEKDIENDRAQRNYTYIQREEERKLDGNGQVKSTETRTFEIMVLFEEPVRKLVAKDDKPLPPKDAAKEEEKIQKIIDERKNEDEGKRKKRLEKQAKDADEGRQFVNEIADAYDFRQTGMEAINGREAYVIDGEPRPGYEPKRKEAKFLPKFRFRAWIDKASSQWVKLDIQCIDTVSVGLFLVRVHQGSNIQIEQTQVNDEVWLPKHVLLKLDARIALFKGINMQEDVTYRDYRKFHTETKITVGGEMQEQKTPQ